MTASQAALQVVVGLKQDSHYPEFRKMVENAKQDALVCAARSGKEYHCGYAAALLDFADLLDRAEEHLKLEYDVRKRMELERRTSP